MTDEDRSKEWLREWARSRMGMSETEIEMWLSEIDLMSECHNMAEGEPEYLDRINWEVKP